MLIEYSVRIIINQVELEINIQKFCDPNFKIDFGNYFCLLQNFEMICNENEIFSELAFQQILFGWKSFPKLRIQLPCMYLFIHCSPGHTEALYLNLFKATNDKSETFKINANTQNTILISWFREKIQKPKRIPF